MLLPDNKACLVPKLLRPNANKDLLQDDALAIRNGRAKSLAGLRARIAAFIQLLAHPYWPKLPAQGSFISMGHR